MNVFAIGGGVAGALIALTVVGGSWYTVSDGYRGVITRNGAVVGTAEPGLGFKMPLIDGVKDISIQSQNRQYEAVSAYSRDQQTAVLAISVSYRFPADSVEEVQVNYGGEEGVLSRLVDRKVLEEVKRVFGQFNAVTSIQERGRLTAEVSEAIIKAIDGPVIIESVQIENIDFSDAYEQSIEHRMLAEVAVEKEKQELAKQKVQAEIAVTQAQAVADSNLAKAKAEAEAIELRGAAEAKAIRDKGAALRDNPSLVDLVQAERWDGVLPQTMIPGGAVPMLSLPAQP